MALITIERQYELGGASTFRVRTARGLVATIARDAREQREGGDCQGIGYAVQSCANALQLGAVEADWGWYLPATQTTIMVECDGCDHCDWANVE